MGESTAFLMAYLMDSTTRMNVAPDCKAGFAKYQKEGLNRFLQAVAITCQTIHVLWLGDQSCPLSLPKLNHLLAASLKQDPKARGRSGLTVGCPGFLYSCTISSYIY